MEGEIQKPQWKSADRGHHRSHPQRGPPLVPAHPRTAGGTNTARSPGKRRLYIIFRRAAGAPARRGDRAAAVPSQPLPRGAGRERRVGRRGGTPGTRGRPQRLTPPEVGDGGRAPSPRMPRAAAAAGGAGDAERGEGELGTGRGPRAPRWLQAPSAPLAAPSGTAPRRTCHAPYLSGFVELLLEPGHRHGAGGRAGGCGCGCPKEAAAERDRRAERGGALAGRPLVVPPPGLWARGRGEARDAGSCGETP